MMRRLAAAAATLALAAPSDTAVNAEVALLPSPGDPDGSRAAALQTAVKEA
jgi:hypothetical protein